MRFPLFLVGGNFSDQRRKSQWRKSPVAQRKAKEKRRPRKKAPDFMPQCDKA